MSPPKTELQALRTRRSYKESEEIVTNTFSSEGKSREARGACRDKWKVCRSSDSFV